MWICFGTWVYRSDSGDSSEPGPGGSPSPGVPKVCQDYSLLGSRLGNAVVGATGDEALTIQLGFNDRRHLSEEGSSGRCPGL